MNKDTVIALLGVGFLYLLYKQYGYKISINKPQENKEHVTSTQTVNKTVVEPPIVDLPSEADCREAVKSIVSERLNKIDWESQERYDLEYKNATEEEVRKCMNS